MLASCSSLYARRTCTVCSSAEAGMTPIWAVSLCGGALTVTLAPTITMMPTTSTDSPLAFESSRSARAASCAAFER